GMGVQVHVESPLRVLATSSGVSVVWLATSMAPTGLGNVIIAIALSHWT
ncbi:hypothetical protein A221_28958, partial [Pseudomonas syringae pv. actinidiae ICMP 18801]